MKNDQKANPSQLPYDDIAALYQNGEYGEVLRRVKNASPHALCAAVLSLAGTCAYLMERYSEAEEHWRSAVEVQPDYADVYNNLGVLLMSLQRFDEAEIAYRQMLRLKPDNVQALSNLGILFKELHRYDEAADAYRRALSLDPFDPKTHNNLANLLKELKNYNAAESAYRQAIALNKEYADAHRNLGMLLKELCRFEEAEKAYRQTLTLRPDCLHTQLNLGFLLLQVGRLEEAWPLHEARYQAYPSSLPLPSLAFPQWRGEPLSGKSILIVPEQGYGDEIQFVRYAALLKKMGASRITVVCKPPLKRLFSALCDADNIITANEAIPMHDYWVFSMSLPLHCKTTLQNIPAQLPYLNVPSEWANKWKPHLFKSAFTVGLVWKGSKAHQNDANRSLNALSMLSPLWSVAEVTFVSLQTEDENETFAPGEPILRLGAAIEDFADTASLITQLDLIICVDTAIAHLAGALGKPCWVLLPAEQTDWRWFTERTDSPWYPNTLRLFRQNDPHSWDETINQVTRALREVVSHPVSAERNK